MVLLNIEQGTQIIHGLIDFNGVHEIAPLSF